MYSSGQQGLGQTSLLLSYASKGDIAQLKQLLAEGASVNSCDYDKRTALHLAASEGHVPVVELLLKHGAFVNPVDRWGDTPLADARKYTSGEVSKILEENGGKVEIKLKLGPLYNVDPSIHYEIDRSELEPLHGIPPLSKTATEEVRLVNWRGTKVVATYILVPLSTNPDILNKLKTELLMLEQMRHPNLVQFLCAVTRIPPPIIVTEYLPRGNLQDMLSQGPIPPKRALGFALDIARGINYLHEHREPVMHGNLKPQNLLQNEAGQLKITDFGMLRTKLHAVSNEGNEMGSYLYMAPEVYRKEPFDKSVDAFAFGIILHEMAEGPQSWTGTTPEGIARKRAYEDVRPAFTVTTYPHGLKQIISACWHKDPSMRPTFGEIIKQLEGLPSGHKGGIKKRFLSRIKHRA